MANETPTISTLIMDRSVPLGNSEDRQNRRALHTKITNKDSEPITVAGSYSPSGLKNAGLITFVTINDTTWTALPPTPLTNRNALTIQNRSGQDIMLAYNSSPTAWLILPVNGERAYDITDNIQIYALSTLGNAQVTIEELS